MTTFLFWNVQKKPLDGHIVRIVEEHKVDVVMLAEHPRSDDVLLSQLNHIRPFHRVPSHERFGVYSAFPAVRMVRVSPPPSVEHDRTDFWDVRISRMNRLFLCLVHGLDVQNYSERRRELFFERLRTAIEWMEANDPNVGHKQTVVVGDFNANPFEAIIGGVCGLHAIRVPDVAGRHFRSVAKREYEFFYNPMWASFRGREQRPAGSYYFNGSDVHEHFWHMIDQVVLRPQSLHMFSERNVRVLTKAGHVSLVTTRGLPDAAGASDHLPLLFKLNLRAKVPYGQPMAGIE